jgi:thiol-disulfide isomerase/thioredoxin
MRIKLLLLFISVVFIACATTKQEKKIITGRFTWSQWQKEAGWESYDAAGYDPGYFLTEQLLASANSNDIEFLLFSGSWCGDSESEVPKIYKLFDKANIPLNKIKLYGVDRNKREATDTAEKYEIKRVPTLVVLRNGKEAGRIIEYPQMSWEEDIFKILVKS